MKKTKDIKEMNLDELQAELLQLRKEQWELRLKKANGVLEKPHHIRNVRRSIARIKTFMTAKAGISHVE